MRRIRLVLGLILVIVVYSSCASNRHVIVTGYEGLGISIEALGKSLKVLCDNGKISQGECYVIGKIYDGVVKAYRDLGDVYAKVIETGSDEDVKDYRGHLEVIKEGLSKLRGYLDEEDNRGD